MGRRIPFVVVRIDCSATCVVNASRSLFSCTGYARSFAVISLSLCSEWTLTVVAIRCRVEKVAGVVIAQFNIGFANVVDARDVCLSELLL